MIFLKNHHKENIPIYIFIAVVLILVVLAFTGCYTPKKAKQQFNKAALNYPEIPAAFCADEFPVNTVTDSTEYKNSKAVIDSLAEALKNDSLLSDEERGRLILEIERVKGLITEPQKCDSLSNSIYKLLNKEKTRGDKLQSAYNNLLAASQNLKPIRDTVENTAALKACEIDKSKTIDLLVKKTSEADKYKGQAKKRGLIMWGLIALLIAYVGLRVYLKSKKIFK